MKSLFLPVLSRSVAVVVVCTLLGTAAFAQAPATSAPGAPATSAEKPKPLASGDSTYVKNAVKSLNYLVQLANSAKGATELNPITQGPIDVNYKRTIDSSISDTAKALGAISKLAEARGEKAPLEVTATENADLERVTKFFAKSDKFDPRFNPNKGLKEWAAAMMREAKRLDHETEMVGKTSQDGDIKTFVSMWSPTIHGIFASAEEMDKALKKTK